MSDVSDEQVGEIKMLRYITIRVPSRTYDDFEDCLAASVRHISIGRKLIGYDLNPIFEDDSRDSILLDIPEHSLKTRDDVVHVY
jgi:hypothetical protein